jgi:glycosyltransferase involved in cell wall biosynthesis
VGRLPVALAELEEPLFHAVCNFNLPLTRIAGKRMVLTVHDIIPELLPEAVSRAYRWQFRLWLSRSLQVADRVICDSQRTRRDLLSRFEVEEDKVVAVHLGADHVDAIPRPDAAGEAYLRSLGLPAQYVLYAGALDARKNVALILDALERLRARGRQVTLVLVGQSWFGSEAVEERISRMRAEGFDLRPLGYQSSPVFYELIRRAAVFVFPSRYEGFGLPPLEAMRLGVPTVVSTAGSLPEVCGEAAVAVHPESPAELATVIDQLLRSPEERARRAEQGRRHAARFTWDATAKATLDVYRSALDLD